MYTYEYPHPAVTADVALLRTGPGGEPEILLIERGREPYKGAWALPGGFIDIDEPLERAALRELEEETGVTGIDIEQLGTFGDPGRDPRERVISVIYFSFVGSGERLAPRAGDDAADVRWWPLAALPPLAFDHDSVVEAARVRLEARLHARA